MRNVLFPLLLVALSLQASAQAPAAGSDWQHLKAVPLHIKVHVAADKISRTCHIEAVTDDVLQCSKDVFGHNAHYTFQRGEVKSVKLTRYTGSTLGGAAIGAGAGAAVGFGLTTNPNGWFNGAARGAFTLLGAVIGAATMGPADTFRGPTVYRRAAVKP